MKQIDRRRLFIKHKDMLIERFPHLYFWSFSFSKHKSLFYDHYKKVNYHHSIVKKPLYDEEHTFQFDDSASTILFYGLGVGNYYFSFLPWLQKNRENRLLFLEDDQEVMEAFLSSENAEKILQDNQVSIYFFDKEEGYEQIFTQLPFFSFSRLSIYAHPFYQQHNYKRCQEIREAVIQKHALTMGTTAEIYKMDDVFHNFLRNRKILKESFRYEGLKDCLKGHPAIICGAGPSLKDHWDILKECTDLACIIAGGSAAVILSQKEIPFHLASAVDPTEQEYLHFKAAEEIQAPFFYAMRLHHRVFEVVKGKKVWMAASCRHKLEESLINSDTQIIGGDLEKEALSISLINLSLAYFLGCDPIIFCGIDMAYEDGKEYAASISEKTIEGYLEKINAKNKKVQTKPEWLMESNCFSSFVKKHPDRKYYNTSKGLGMAGVVDITLEEVKRTRLKKKFDYSLFLDQKIACMPVAALDEAFIKKIIYSIYRCKILLDAILSQIKKEPLGKVCKEKSGYWILYEVELEEELAYRELFSQLPLLIDYHLSFLHPKEKTYGYYLSLYKIFTERVEKHIAIIHEVNRSDTV